MVDRKLRSVLDELRSGLERIYGKRLVELVLYGSRARGDAEADSDIDVLVLVTEMPTRRQQAEASRWISDLCLDNDIVVSEIYMPLGRYRSQESPLAINAMREGVVI